MTTSTSVPTQHLTRPLLAELHQWWFRGVPSQRDQLVPPDTFQRWFSTSPEFDSECSKKYAPAVLESQNLSIQQLNEIASTPDEAVAMILILDQIPRNIFRGSEAIKVHNDYDPVAREMTKRFLYDRGYQAREQFPHFAPSIFLGLPLMHSEDLADHDLLQKFMKERMEQATSDAEKEGIKRVVDFEDKHRKVLEKFGRYPSRNEAMKRESTKAELEFLKDGPGW